MSKTDQNRKSASKSPLLAAVERLQAQVAEIRRIIKLLQQKVDKNHLEQSVDHTQQQVTPERGNKTVSERGHKRNK